MPAIAEALDEQSGQVVAMAAAIQSNPDSGPRMPAPAPAPITARRSQVRERPAENTDAEEGRTNSNLEPGFCADPDPCSGSGIGHSSGAAAPTFASLNAVPEPPAPEDNTVPMPPPVSTRGPIRIPGGHPPREPLQHPIPASLGGPEEPGGGPSASNWEALDDIDEMELMIGSVPTIVIIPKAARTMVARCQDLVHEACASPVELIQDRGAVLEIVFESTVMADSRGGKHQAKELKRKCARFLSGDWMAMWATRQKPTPRGEDTKDKRLLRALKKADMLAREGRMTDAMEELNMNMTAKVGVQQVEELLGKHPRNPAGRSELPDDAPPGIVLNKKILRDIALSPPPRKGTSTNGCRLEHLANAAEYGDMNLLHKACCAIAEGALSPKALRLAAIGKLVALQKPDGSVRPIGVGSARRRLTGKAMAKQENALLAAISHTRRAVNFALAYPSGSEAEIWLTRARLSAHPEEMTLQVDGVNAFNALHREPMLEACKERAPSFYRYAHAFYGAHQADMVLSMEAPWPNDMPVPPGVTILGSENEWVSISSEVGLTQGDALAMILFCITLQGPLEAVAEAFPDLDVSSFADDGRITGDGLQVVNAYHMLKQKMEDLGLMVKIKDLKAWSPTRQPDEVVLACRAAQITLEPPTGGVLLLSSPLGSLEWMKQAVVDQWRGKGADEMPLADREFMGLAGKLTMVGSMDIGQAQDAMVRYVASSWLSYLTRTAPPAVLVALEQYDTAIGRLIMQTKGGNGPISPWIKAFSHLPLKWGGWGCSSSADTMLRANVSSWIAVRTDLELLYPGTMDCMKSGSGQLADQFQDSLRTIQSQVVKAREALATLPQWKLPPKYLLAQAQLDLTYTDDLVNDLLLDGVNAPYTRPQKPLASSSNVVNWFTCISTGTPEQHSWLIAGAQTGGRAWVEPGHGTASAADNNPFKSNKTNISDRAFLFASQCAMGLEPVGMPKVNHCQKAEPPCKNPLINPTAVRGHAKSGVLHAASHFELLNMYIHKPVVIALFNCFRLHGFNVTYGDLGREFYDGRKHKHSADLTVEAWYGPNRHLRIDVKSACDYGITNRKQPGGIEAHLKLMELRCREQHGNSEVLPFAITTSGGMGKDAIDLIKKLGERGVGMVQVANEMQLNWLVPSHGKYWHRRLRGLAIVGWYNTYRVCMGLAYTEDQFAGRGDITVKDAMRLRGVLEGEHHCPMCGSEQDDCICICRPVNFSDGCGGRCAFGRIWPPCVACSTCGSCCRCIDNPQLQQRQPVSQSAAPEPALDADQPSEPPPEADTEQPPALAAEMPPNGEQPSDVGVMAMNAAPLHAEPTEQAVADQWTARVFSQVQHGTLMSGHGDMVEIDGDAPEGWEVPHHAPSCVHHEDDQWP